jgi:hypothetical protein
MSKAKFTVTIDEVIYNCYREISGKRVLAQTVIVENIGIEDDKEEYGYSLPYQDVQLMVPNAKLIARRIIRNSKNTQSILKSN